MQALWAWHLFRCILVFFKGFQWQITAPVALYSCLLESLSLRIGSFQETCDDWRFISTCTFGSFHRLIAHNWRSSTHWIVLGWYEPTADILRSERMDRNGFVLVVSCLQLLRWWLLFLREIARKHLCTSRWEIAVVDNYWCFGPRNFVRLDNQGVSRLACAGWCVACWKCDFRRERNLIRPHLWHG